jgi:hypothetical protein
VTGWTVFARAERKDELKKRTSVKQITVDGVSFTDNMATRHRQTAFQRLLIVSKKIISPFMQVTDHGNAKLLSE